MKTDEVLTVANTTEDALAAELAQEDAARRAALLPKAATAETANGEDDVPAAEGKPEGSEPEGEPEEVVTDDLSQTATEETEEAPEETPAEPEGEAEPETEGKPPKIGRILDEIEGLKPEDKAIIGEGVNKLLRHRLGESKALHEEALATERTARETAEARVAELEANGTTAVTPSAGNPLGHVTTQAALDKEASNAEQVIEDCERLLPELGDNPEWVAAQLKAAKVKLTNAAGEEDYSEARMRSFLERIKGQSERNLRRHIPARAQQLAETRAGEAEAVTRFPVLKDKNHDFTKKVEAALKQFPEIARSPVGKILIAGALRDSIAQAKAAKPAAAPVVKAPLAKAKPPIDKAASKPVAREGVESAELVAARKRFYETNSPQDLETLEAAEEKERRRR